jgi:hypothetical protein
MKNISKLVIVALLMGLCLPVRPALADPKPWIWSWGFGHFDNLDFIPYLEDGTHPQHSQWERSNWKPEDWIAQRPDAKTLMDGFYKADIVREQFVHRDTPVLVVGPSFYMLGGEDQIRVARTVDHIWRVTASRPNGMFMLHDWKTGKTIGSYTKNGLQLQ